MRSAAVTFRARAGAHTGDGRAVKEPVEVNKIGYYASSDHDGNKRKRLTSNEFARGARAATARRRRREEADFYRR
ncbi:hypothetical protein EVAR_9962_1 [Eumeta japonica]|uniref:Uncharacterized protein n=1 Tax=Eumeta variegata TaxID=151549 RepID=A0A4C1TQX7_EUMVA|nr:hypothetical protein EVAR_9962_1 [Eumeta japonica]